MTKVSEITSKAIADIIEYYKPVGGKIAELDAQYGHLSDFLTFNIESYGAVGKDSDKDTQALLSAISAAQAIGQGKVTIPAKEFYISQSVNVPQFVSIEGADKNASILNFINGTDGLVLSPYVDFSHGNIRNIKISRTNK